MSKLNSVLILVSIICLGLSREAVNHNEKSIESQQEMSDKLRVCYQNLGFGTSVTRKLHDLLNVLNSRHPHILFVSETMIDIDAITRIESLGFTIEAMPQNAYGAL